METREATPRDRPGIRRIAEQSFQTSYPLSPEQIAVGVGAVFSDGASSVRIGTDRNRLFVATGDEALDERSAVGAL